MATLSPWLSCTSTSLSFEMISSGLARLAIILLLLSGAIPNSKGGPLFRGQSRTTLTSEVYLSLSRIRTFLRCQKN